MKSPIFGRYVFIAGVFAVCAGVHAAPVGRVLMAAGDAVAIRDAGELRLAFGSPIEERDILRTGPDSSLQVRFNDEAILSLREQSQVRIEEYRYDGKEDGLEKVLLNLLKGGFRTVTGIIGRTNRANYAVQTPTSTIGIRGTDYALRDCRADCRNTDGTVAKDGVYGNVLGASARSNQVSVTNSAGERVFGKDQPFYVADANTLPESLIGPPTFLSAARLAGEGKSTAKQEGGKEEIKSAGIQAESRLNPAPEPLQRLEFISTERRDASGNPVALPRPAGFLVVYPFALGSHDLGIAEGPSIKPVYNSLNQLIGYGTLGVHPAGSLGGGSISDAIVVQSSGGDVYSFGRWTGSSLVTAPNGATLSGLPLLFITGSSIGSEPPVPTSGIVNYRFAGGPRPVDFGGNVGNVAGSSASINFASQRIDLLLRIIFPAGGTLGGPADFQLSGGGTQTGEGLFGGGLGGVCIGNGCRSPAASGSFGGGTTGGSLGVDFLAIAGGFSGTTAGQVVFLNGYQGSGVGTVTVLDTSGFPATTATTAATSLPAQVLAFAWHNSSIGAIGGQSGPYSFAGSTLTGYVAGVTSGSLGSASVVETDANPATFAAGKTAADAAAAGNLHWGRWSTPGTMTVSTPSTGTLSNPPTGVPYVFGDRTGTMPASGSAIYSYIGGPNPVNTSGAIGAFSGGSFNVNFVTRNVAINSPLTLSVAGVSYSMNSCVSCSYASATAPSVSGSISGTCSGGACSASSAASGPVAGHFTGTAAQGLALGGLIFSPAPFVAFAAGFKP